MARMRAKTLYLVLCVAGAIVPLFQFVPWARDHGLDLRLLVQELFSTRIGAFFGLDVIVSALVLIAFVIVERSRVTVRWWWLSIVGTLCIGVSFGLPLYLFLRERTLDAE